MQAFLSVSSQSMSMLGFGSWGLVVNTRAAFKLTHIHGCEESMNLFLLQNLQKEGKVRPAGCFQDWLMALGFGVLI